MRLSWKGIPLREHEFVLELGDSLYVYTNRLVEATNGQEELFCTKQMLKALNRQSQTLPKELLYTVKEEIDAFAREGGPV